MELQRDLVTIIKKLSSSSWLELFVKITIGVDRFDNYDDVLDKGYRLKGFGD